MIIMGLLNWLGIGEEIAKPIDAVGRLYTTEENRLNAEANLTDIEQKPRLAQLEINQVMASSNHWFESLWQPLIGWTSGFCVFLYWVPQLLITNYIWASGCLTYHQVIPFPIQPDDIYNLVWLLFGFAGYTVVKKALNK